MRILNISECGIDTLCAMKIGEGLMKNRIITSLDISGNTILPKGASSIADGIENHRSLN